jgi:subtilase family serine protease
VIAAGRPDTVRRGRAFAVEFTVENQGEGPAPSSEVRLYLSSDAVLSADDMDLGARASIPALGEGARYSTYDLAVTVPSQVKRGSYSLLFVSDPLKRVAESNEGNNTRPRPLDVR